MKNKRNVFKVLDVVIGSAILSSLFVLLNATGVYADVVDTVTITVPVSCSMTSIVGTEHTTSINVGTYEDEIGETTFKVLCNDANGFAVYAIGYSNDEYGNTTMKPATLPDSNGIVTGTATSGSTSNWAMKLAAVSGDYTPTLATGFDAYHAVPDEYTKVASLSSSTDATIGSSFKSTYAAFISQAQAADTYVGKVKYTIVHPSDAAAPITPDAVMQNMDSSECTSTPINVIDNRDDHIYVAQRLADGNCWMMENLDLGRTELTTDLTSANTNLATTVTATTFNGWKNNNPYASTNNDDGRFDMVDGSDSVSGTAYGTLYNYYAASAGTITGSAMANDAVYDICPSGWKMPSNSIFTELITSYQSPANIRAPIASGGAAFVLSGFYASYEPQDTGDLGRYWTSSKIIGGRSMGVFYVTDDDAALDQEYPFYGHAVRCVLKERIMQDVSSWGSSIQEGEEVIAKDKRDGKLYTVARLADGNLWMTQNLDHDIDATKTYTPADTDIPANWTPSTSTQTGNTSWNNSHTTPESYDPGEEYFDYDGLEQNNLFNNYLDSCYNGTCDESIYALLSDDYITFLNTCDAEFEECDWNSFPENISSSGDSHYHIGNYYNWTAALALNNSSSYTSARQLVDQSICPAGWALPRDGKGDDSFYALFSEYNTPSSGGNSNDAEAVTDLRHFSLAGGLGGIGQRGLSGHYWSAVTVNNNDAYGLIVSSYGAQTSGNPVIRYYGISIRCIARPVTNQIVTDLP